MDGEALECTHITDTNGRFRQGLVTNLAAGETYTFSFFYKNGNFTSPYGQQYFDIGLAYVGMTTGGGGGLATLVAFPNDWYRQKITFMAKESGDFQLAFVHSLTRMPGGGYWVYGVQVEIGSSATEYVPE